MKITCPLCRSEDISFEGNCHNDDDNIVLEVSVTKEAVWCEGELIEEEFTEGFDSPVEFYQCNNGHGWYM